MKLAPPGTGSNPPRYSYTPPTDDSSTSSSLPVPWWFHPTSAQTLKSLPLRESDVIVSSGVKMGTTWVTKILVSLLYEYDDSGMLRDGVERERKEIPNRLGQSYPDAMYANRDEKEADVDGFFSRVPNGRVACDAIFGDFTFEDLVNQPDPRLFTTHLFGRRFLPQQLFNGTSNSRDTNDSKSTEGKGRLIIVIRNLKDTMCSLHHFRGLPLDGWDGNEHGPGTFRRFIADECPNAFGSTFDWLKDTNDALNYVDEDRVHVVHYESFILDFDAQLRALNDFLGLSQLTNSKCDAIRQACDAKTMVKDQARYTAVVEKGKIGEWEKYLDADRWEEFDRVFDERLKDVEIAEPMRFFQCRGFQERLSDDSKNALDSLKKQWSSFSDR